MEQKTFYKMKKEFFAHKRELIELQRAINSKDKEEIKRQVEMHFEHLHKIFRLCGMI